MADCCSGSWQGTAACQQLIDRGLMGGTTKWLVLADCRARRATACHHLINAIAWHKYYIFAFLTSLLPWTPFTIARLVTDLLSWFGVHGYMAMFLTGLRPICHLNHFISDVTVILSVSYLSSCVALLSPVFIMYTGWWLAEWIAHVTCAGQRHRFESLWRLSLRNNCGLVVHTYCA